MLYLECHITIEPVFNERLEQASQIALDHKFKIANLLMQKREHDQPERSKHDTFMTSHSQDLDDMKIRMINLIDHLKQYGFKVWRYKIEDVIIDSKIIDELELLK